MNVSLRIRSSGCGFKSMIRLNWRKIAQMPALRRPKGYRLSLALTDLLGFAAAACILLANTLTIALAAAVLWMKWRFERSAAA